LTRAPPGPAGSVTGCPPRPPAALSQFALPGHLQCLRRNHRPQLRRELLLDLGEPSLPGQLDDGQGTVAGEVFVGSFFLMLVVYRFIRL
jgi:hypothetical protein